MLNANFENHWDRIFHNIKFHPSVFSQDQIAYMKEVYFYCTIIAEILDNNEYNIDKIAKETQCNTGLIEALFFDNFCEQPLPSSFCLALLNLHSKARADLQKQYATPFTEGITLPGTAKEMLDDLLNQEQTLTEIAHISGISKITLHRLQKGNEVSARTEFHLMRAYLCILMDK